MSPSGSRNITATLNYGTVSGMGSGAGQPGRGVDLGYARVSATRQSLERQLDAPAAAGIPAQRTWAGKKTGTDDGP